MIGGFGLAPSLPSVLAHIHTDQGPEFIAEAGESRIAAVGARTICIERDSRENGCVEIACLVVAFRSTIRRERQIRA